MMGNISEKISIGKVLKALGVKQVVTQDPLRLEQAIAAVQEAVDFKGTAAVIFESPCIAVTKPSPLYSVDLAKCTGCKRCIKELGCPAIVKENTKVRIDASWCSGCSICAQVCPFEAIGGVQK
mgnify:FL=1